jgi:DNA-binding NarL/FixJ family response regulator
MRISGVARTAPQATVLANRLSPDVVVASVQLPGGLYRLVRYLADELGVPTVVLTPPPQEAALAAHDRDVLPAVRSGATAFVEEGTVDLVDVIERVVVGEAVLSGHHVALVLEELRAVELAAERRRRGSAVRLTEREWDVVELLRRGSSTAQIAAELGIAPVTVRTHVSAILRRLHVTTRDEALEKLLPVQRSGAVLTHLNTRISAEQSAPDDSVLPSGSNGI